MGKKGRTMFVDESLAEALAPCRLAAARDAVDKQCNRRQAPLSAREQPEPEQPGSSQRQPGHARELLFYL